MYRSTIYSLAEVARELLHYPLLLLHTFEFVHPIRRHSSNRRENKGVTFSWSRGLCDVVQLPGVRVCREEARSMLCQEGSAEEQVLRRALNYRKLGRGKGMRWGKRDRLVEQRGTGNHPVTRSMERPSPLQSRGGCLPGSVRTLSHLAQPQLRPRLPPCCTAHV